jgi:hypothetical protein
MRPLRTVDDWNVRAVSVIWFFLEEKIVTSVYVLQIVTRWAGAVCLDGEPCHVDSADHWLVWSYSNRSTEMEYCGNSVKI